jgi:hypothetical protein
MVAHVHYHFVHACTVNRVFLISNKNLVASHVSVTVLQLPDPVDNVLHSLNWQEDT